MNNLELHANEQNPYEACAILLGNKDEKIWNVTEIFLTENIEKSEINFTVSNEQLLEGYKMAEERGLDIVGIFHSHPNTAASPSNFDKKFMKINGDVPWVIFSGLDADLKAYMLEENMEDEKEIKIKVMERHFFQ